MVALCLALPLVGQAHAGDYFLGNDKVFSGVANANGEGLIVPQTIVSGANFGISTQVESDIAGTLDIVTTVGGGDIATGLTPFPIEPDAEFRLQTRVLGNEIGWGLRPYVGVGVSSNPAERGVFQGIARLLPYETDTIGVQGVAGIAYELMPGIGAGLEYRYQTYTAESPIMAGPSDNQTIMMRLDLGLN